MQLLIFSLIILPIIILERFESSFLLYSFYDDFNTFILCLLIISWLVFKYKDYLNKTKTNYYFIIMIILFSVFMMVTNLLINLLNKHTEKKGVIISEYIQKYKIEKGKNPSNLEEIYFENISTKTSFGTKFYIKKYYKDALKDTVCFVWFEAMSGLRGSYNPITKKWRYLD